MCYLDFATPALKSSPSKKSRSALAVPKHSGPGAAWSASQLPSERDHHIYDLRGARSFPVLENDGNLFICVSPVGYFKFFPPKGKVILFGGFTLYYFFSLRSASMYSSII